MESSSSSIMQVVNDANSRGIQTFNSGNVNEAIQYFGVALKRAKVLVVSSMESPTFGQEDSYADSSSSCCPQSLAMSARPSLIKPAERLPVSPLLAGSSGSTLQGTPFGLPMKANCQEEELGLQDISLMSATIVFNLALCYHRRAVYSAGEQSCKYQHCVLFQKARALYNKALQLLLPYCQSQEQQPCLVIAEAAAGNLNRLQQTIQYSLCMQTEEEDSTTGASSAGAA